ncbi:MULTISPECIES: PDZ domain-containing protein [unclassified Pseudonocardia]|uniref:YlbL family protein n=1 Tax=unclassified Pseudonocardia TaxID=2619320 RepID=UPI0009F886C8
MGSDSVRDSGAPLRIVVLLAATVALGAVGSALPVPLVSESAGPTVDVLGESDGRPVIATPSTAPNPPAGRLLLTTVSVTDDLNGLTAAKFWFDGDHRLVPRSSVYPPGLSYDELQNRNSSDFADSEVDAVAAALSLLRIPQDVSVHNLTDGSPAAGILRPGDLITRIDGQEIGSIESVRSILSQRLPGDVVTIEALRSGHPESVDIRLSEGSEIGSGVVGVTLSVRPRSSDQVEISLKGIGGPSAGLIFALGVFERLSPKSIIRGRDWSGTGVITPEGAVKPISGAEFKVAAARNAGAKYFLVPRENCSIAAGANVDGIQVLGVSDLKEAVSIISAPDLPPGNRC